MTPLRAAISKIPSRQQVAGFLPVITRLSVGTVVLALGLLAADAANAQGVVKSKFGDWEIRCDTPPGPAPSNAL